MPGINALRRIQIGQMAAFGGSDVPDTYWRGTGMLDDTREVTFPDEHLGIVGGVNHSYTARTGGEVTLEGNASFEQLGYVFDSGIHAETPTPDSGSGHIYQWTMQNVSTDPITESDLKYLVIETGDNQQAERMRDGFVREFSITGSAGEALSVSAMVQGREVAPVTFTGGLSIPTIESILFSKGSLFIDASSGTPGTTQKSNTLLNMNLNVTSGWQAIESASGRLDLSGVKFVGSAGTLEVTFEHDGTATAEIANWRSEAERVIRLEFPGTDLASAGAYTTKLFRVDLYGKWENFEPIGEQDGNDIVTGTFRIGYSSVAAARGEFTIVNELSALP